MTHRGPGPVLSALDRLERWTGADQVIDAVQQKVRSVPLGAGRDALHGRWLGHPVHPLLVQVPIGSWLSATVLDLLPGVRRGPRALIGIGLATAVPAAVAGWVDWAELHRQQQRVGLVHALANGAAISLFAGSVVARFRGRERAGKALGLAGLSVTGLGGALGGHMAYRQASGANHAEYVPHVVTPGWHRLGDVADFPVGQVVRRHVDEVPVMVVHESGNVVRVLADRCSHMAGPLSEGDIIDGCVRCPWHGSVFRLADGWNVRGPATAPQPAFDARIVDGAVEARLRNLETKTRNAG
ncbi:Rieske 2Fe-2S domain-containing protein [Streptomyces kebangsaanensis]|uniref:Rieske 2Fe-2S domain-containing protein n=1 Tax=Streptomyces kebangsaanensis TaxID=864058 RepID=UPI000940505E|nr:Rieske 2Fe-2S domain-containing protein [Streptomyces kebangsaanensis]